jgi:hypothetical protein
MNGMRMCGNRWLSSLILCLAIASPALGQERSADGPRLSADWSDLVSGIDIAREMPHGRVMPTQAPLPLYSTGPIPLMAAPTAPPQDKPQFCCDRRYVWATLGEVGILLVVPWYFNRHVADDSTAVLSFDSWKRNIVQGMEWDADAFQTNMWAHPYHGNVYFNAARSNGYNFWQSSAWAWGGSFLWETFGENNRPAINDWAATAIGGIALGESLNRMSRLIWDNSATGFGRTMREFGGFLVNPLGGFSRLVRGEWTKVGANPEDRFPTRSAGDLVLGFRSVGEGGQADASSGGFFAFDYQYGNAFEDFDHPYDAFRFYIQMNGSNEEQSIGQAHLTGSLYGTELKRTEKADHVFHLAQHFDYVNIRSLETGGSSLSATFLSRWKVSDKWSILARAEPSALLIWGVNSEYPDFTRRSYDFGSGAGLRLGGQLRKGKWDILDLRYSFFWQHTLNGGVGDHLLHFLSAHARVPIYKAFDIGVTGYYSIRDSYYRDFPDVFRRFPEFRAYATWSFE